MKNFSKAMSELIKDGNKIRCDKIPFTKAKSILGSIVEIEENSTGKRFEAIVVDCCFDDQAGFIVRIKKEQIPGMIRKYNMGESDVLPRIYVECDMRNIFNGKHFTLIRVKSSL